MDFISESVLFAAISGSSLAGGILTHTVAVKLRRKTPVQALRVLYANAVICAGVGILLIGDSLFA